MKTLVWAEQYWPLIGGAELFLARLMAALGDRGFDFAVVTRRDSSDLPAVEKHEGVPVYRYPLWSVATGRNPDEIAALRRQLQDLLTRFSPDVTHVNGFAPTSALFHHLTTSGVAIPSVVTLHGRPRRAGLQNGTDSTLVQTLTRAAHVVSCSQAVLSEAREMVPAIRERSSLIRHGIVVPVKEPSPLPLDPPVILCLGRLQNVKGFDVALDAFAVVLGRLPRARMIIAGDGEMRSDLERRASELEISGSVEFTGWITPTGVPAAIESATVVVVPSRDEGFGLVALEAAALGRPVVASRVGGLPEVVEDGQTGILVEPDDQGALAEAVTRVLIDPAVAWAMGSAGRRRAAEEFRWEAVVDAYESLFQSVQVQR